ASDRRYLRICGLHSHWPVQRSRPSKKCGTVRGGRLRGFGHEPQWGTGVSVGRRTIGKRHSIRFRNRLRSIESPRALPRQPTDLETIRSGGFDEAAAASETKKLTRAKSDRIEST